MIEDLLQRAQRTRPSFPPENLPIAAADAVRNFLTTTHELLPPHIDQLVTQLLAETQRAQVREAIAAPPAHPAVVGAPLPAEPAPYGS